MRPCFRERGALDRDEMGFYISKVCMYLFRCTFFFNFSSSPQKMLRILPLTKNILIEVLSFFMNLHNMTIWHSFKKYLVHLMYLYNIYHSAISYPLAPKRTKAKNNICEREMLHTSSYFYFSTAWLSFAVAIWLPNCP